MPVPPAQLNSGEHLGLRILAGLEVFQIPPSRCVAHTHTALGNKQRTFSVIKRRYARPKGCDACRSSGQFLDPNSTVVFWDCRFSMLPYEARAFEQKLLLYVQNQLLQGTKIAEVFATVFAKQGAVLIT